MTERSSTICPLSPLSSSTKQLRSNLVVPFPPLLHSFPRNLLRGVLRRRRRRARRLRKARERIPLAARRAAAVLLPALVHQVHADRRARFRRARGGRERRPGVIRAVRNAAPEPYAAGVDVV